MKSRFEPDIDRGAGLKPAARLIDPEAYDASEVRFAASVEEKSTHPRFVVDGLQEWSGSSTAGKVRLAADGGDEAERECAPPNPAETSPITEVEMGTVLPSPSLQAELRGPQDSGSWRHEVAARVNHYRARRRPRLPRYPSLQLKFDAPESSWTGGTGSPARAASISHLAVATQEVLAPQEEKTVPLRIDDGDGSMAAEGSARILEFPRAAVATQPVFYELAEPVLDRPRILEVPELELPPPALGGILIEPAEEAAQERRPGFELPLQAAPMSKRLAAGAIDCLIVVAGFAAFAYIFFRITAIVPPLRQTAAISVSLLAIFWVGYQYLLLIHTGITPGLRLAHLQLSLFNGAAAPRRTRRWRVLASALSGLSLGLGYAWCFLDEDRLCWHDRITRTYMAPQPIEADDPKSD